MKKRIIRLCSLTLILIMLGGCWDKVEINERGFVLILGIDKLPEKEKTEPYESIKLSLKFPNVAMLGTKQPISKETAFYWEGEGESMDTIMSEIEGRSPFTIDIFHTKSIVLGENLLKDENIVREVLDGIERERAFSRKVYLVASREKASTIVKEKPSEQPIIGMYLRNILQDGIRQGRTVNATLNHVANQLAETKSTVLPLVSLIGKEKRVNVSGGVVIKNYKLAGELTDNEVKILNMITEDNNNNVINIHVQSKGVPITYEISTTNRQFKVKEKENHLIADIQVKMEGDIKQHKLGIRGAIANDKEIRKVERLIEGRVKRSIYALMEKLQKEYNADVIGANSYLYKFNPKLYKKVNADWDHYFKTMEINVKVESNVRRIGIVR